MAWVRKRGGSWELHWRTAAGGWASESSTAIRTKSEAQRIAREREHEEEMARLGSAAAHVKTRFSTLAEKYLAAVVPTHSDPNTARGHIRNHLLPAFGDKLIHQITPHDIQALLTSKQGKLSPRTREHLRMRLQTMFEYARKQLRVFKGDNPAKLVPKVKTDRTRPKYLPLEYVPRVIAAADEPELLAWAFYLGQRKGEICGQLVEDVDLPGRTVRVWRSYGKSTKGNRERLLPIPEALVPWVERALANAGALNSKWLFPAADGGMRTRDWKAARAFRVALKNAGLIAGWRHTCRRKGCRFGSELRQDDAVSRCPLCGMVLWPEKEALPFTLKHARSTWGTYAYRATGDIRFVQAGLGHQDVSVTMAHYAHHMEEHRREQANRLPYAIGSDLPPGSAETAQNHPPAAEGSEPKREKNP